MANGSTLDTSELKVLSANLGRASGAIITESRAVIAKGALIAAWRPVLGDTGDCDVRAANQPAAIPGVLMWLSSPRTDPASLEALALVQCP